MTALERSVHSAQRRLWLNRGLRGMTFALATVAALFAVVVIVQRLYDLAWPMWLIAAGLLAVGFAGAMIWTVLTRESPDWAAAKLDEAAGLRERLSSGRFCLNDDDPFARAVLADAESVGASITPRKHIPLTWPRSAGWSAASILACTLCFLITPGLLSETKAEQSGPDSEQAEQARVAVKRQMDKVKKLAEASPVVEELLNNEGDLDPNSGGQLRRPGGIRHEAVKKIDRLEDAIKKKRESGEYHAVRNVRRMLRGITKPDRADAPTQKLAQSLQKGDFKTAKEEVEKLREQLATLKADDDKEMVKALSKQLDALAKQIEKLAVDKKLAQKLQQLGVKKEDLKRLLENLTKKDLDQIKKQLAEKGMSQKQIQKLAQKLKKQQQAGSMAKKLAQAMKQGAQGSQGGQVGDAMAGLSKAADQLGELEMLEAEMQQLDSTLAELEDAKGSLDKPCPSCGGAGCARCEGRDGRSGGMGKLGQGRGKLAPEQKTAVGFKTQRAKVKTGAGAIIGQVFFEGEQVKGEVSSSVVEIVAAGERDASDRINRNRVPRQYQKAVREYFSNVKQRMNGEDNTGAEPRSDKRD